MADKKLSIVKKNSETVKLTGERFLQWKLHESAIRHADREKQLLEALINEEVNKNPRLVALMLEKNKAMSAISMELGQLQAVLKQAEIDLGVPLANCQIDDQTGEVHTTTNDGGHVPLTKDKEE